ncbi:dipeptidase [Marinibacterium profundimaris]|uniref:Peptidase M19 n=1 Tax=Marinibacterium profundimaris TaxID=1679460 RepID=A0A225NTG5_9RHOB|nr:dipeptidase [Marinibacterium profundimaris]OWU74900.1 peptidase M19 [Marinibacterium profundimaris]
MIDKQIFFDGHNDTVLRVMRGQVTPGQLADGLPDGHIDRPRAQSGGLGGGFFAVFTPNPDGGSDRDAQMKLAAYDVPKPEPLDQGFALDWTRRGFDALEAMEQAGAITLCRTAAEVAAALPGEPLAAVLHAEGAEAIDPDFAVLHELHARGLRSLGPVWSRDTIFGHGVPFRYPADPDIGPGLTDLGRALVRECNRLRIMIDLSHLNAAGVDDVAAITDAPLVATHSNAWAVCNHARNLTDRQLDMIRESDGMVGINLASAFLRPDGRKDDDFELDILLRHFDHLVERLGEDRIGLGSDFDGSLVPRPIRDCAGLPNLVAALQAHGVDDTLLAKVTHGNWLRVLKRTWGE